MQSVPNQPQIPKLDDSSSPQQLHNQGRPIGTSPLPSDSATGYSTTDTSKIPTHEHNHHPKVTGKDIEKALAVDLIVAVLLITASIKLYSWLDINTYLTPLCLLWMTLAVMAYNVDLMVNPSAGAFFINLYSYFRFAAYIIPLLVSAAIFFVGVGFSIFGVHLMLTKESSPWWKGDEVTTRAICLAAVGGLLLWLTIKAQRMTRHFDAALGKPEVPIEACHCSH